MTRARFAHRLGAAVLATLVLWTPLASTLARAEDLAPMERASEAVGNVLRESETRDALRDAVLAEGAGAEEALREGVSIDWSDIELEDVEGAGAEEQVEGVGEPAEDGSREDSSLTPRNLPSGPGKTAVTPQQIVLPKGEGSIQGMGESFTPNLSSGTGSFTVPIALPSGRAGVQPNLALSYATTGGNGLLGFGWSLAVPFIARQTDKGLPQYVDDTAWHPQEDTFMYNGGQELVPIDSATATRMEGAPVPAELRGWQQYRARVEGGFMRFFRAPDASRWVVQSKDGTRFDFGHTSNGAPGDRAVQSDPENPSRIFSWALVRMSDVHGSAVHYRYTEDAGSLRLESIYYTSPASCASDNPALARECAAPLSHYAHRVRFVYEPREDVTSSYVTSWRIEQRVRLARIEITSADERVGSRFLVRRYHLQYDPASFHSLLTSVQVEGRPSRFDGTLEALVGDPGVAEESLGPGVVGDLLPPMRFGYTHARATSDEVDGFGGIDTTVHESAASPDHSADEGRVDFFDVNFDGLPDLLVTDPARYDGGAGVYFNGFAGGLPGQAGSFSVGQRVDIPPGLAGTLNLANHNIVPMDVDGDGRADLLHMPRASNYGYFVLSKKPVSQGRAYEPLAGWSFHHVTDLLPRGVTDPRIDLGKDGEAIKTLDVNNDHLVDVVRTTGTVIQTWINLGRYPGGEGRFGSASFEAGTWKLSTRPVESCLPFAGRNFSFADAGVRIADMNGDGLEDLVEITPDEVVWWPGRGAGAWGDGAHACDVHTRDDRELRMDNPPRELNAELAGLHVFDVNSDGASDLVQVGFDHLSVWFNRGGLGYTDRVLVENTPLANDALDRVRVADIDGSATTDIVFAESGDYRWIDPMGGVKPRLLSSVDNGLGALTTLEYSSSAVDYLRDLAEATSCNPASPECFTWQREPPRPNGQSGCDERVMERSGSCVHRPAGSPVISTVVRRVATTDRLSALGAEEHLSETEYRYHDGYYEGIEQEFRGFGAADAIVEGDVHGPTSYTRTHFHQGRRPNEIAVDRLADNPNEALKGRELLTEVHDGAGIYLSTSHATYAVRRLFEGLNGVDVSYAYVKARDEYRYDTALDAQRAAPPARLDSVAREVAGPGLESVSEGTPESGDAPHLVAVRHLGHVRLRTTIDAVDNVGSLRSQTSWGRGGRGEFGELIGDERTVQRTVPARVPDSFCGDTGWLWRTVDSWTSDQSESTVLGRTQTSYTPCGDPRTTTRFVTLPATGAFAFGGDAHAAAYTQRAGQELTSFEVDTWGQVTRTCGGAELTSSTDACLRLGSVAYDEAYQQVVVAESTAVDAEAANTLTTTATWDRGLGVLRSMSDPNGYRSELFVDGLGRITATLAPPVRGCENTRVPLVRIAYDVTTDPAARPLSRITTTTLLSCGAYGVPDNQLVSHAYVDGLGRTRVALAEGESDPAAFDDSSAHPFRLSGRQIFSKKGHARVTYQTAYYDGSPDDFAAVLTRPNVPYVRATHDAFGRPRLSVNEDGSYRSVSYHALSTDVCDEVDNGFGANDDGRYAGTCTTERTDGHGRSIDQQLRQVTLDGKREQHRLFTYYRADGAVLRVVRALTGDNVLRPESGAAGGLLAFVERRFHYDSLGRRIASEDPDTDNRSHGSLSSRTWRYLFNPVGDLAAVRDPRGCGQNFYYDLAGRLIGEAYVSCAEAQAAEPPSADVPAGSVGLGLLGSAMPVHTRNTFDRYLDWANYDGISWVRGFLTSIEDRGQRSSFSYDERGNVTAVGKQVAVIPDEVELGTSFDSTGRPRTDQLSEEPASLSTVVYPSWRHDLYTRYDHAGRVVSTIYPRDTSFEVAGTYVEGRLSYYRSGAPRRTELVLGGVSYPVIDRISYTRDGLPAVTRYGDGANTGRRPTESRTLYDARRRPVQLFTSRSPAAGRDAETLGAVGTVHYQHLSWDAASNLYLIEDRRNAAEWPAGHKPVDQHIFHDALYRVAAVSHVYRTETSLDDATDWRTEEDRHRDADPMHSVAAPMIAAQAPHRVVDLEYSHDWLANMTSWHDDAHVFYERSIGRIVNGSSVTPSASLAAPRPSALYLASDLADAATGDLGGWLETDYGVSGNLVGMTVHAQCTHVSSGSCTDHEDAALDERRRGLREGCECASEQHYVYRYDELNRLHEARRYDRDFDSEWTLAARQRYRYDGANQRVVKQTFDLLSGEHRAAVTPFPGDFEERGLVVNSAGTGWQRTREAESQFSVAGARVVWKMPDGLLTGPNPEYRTTTPPQAGLARWFRADTCEMNLTTQRLVCNDRKGGPAAQTFSSVDGREPSIDQTGIGGLPTLVTSATTGRLIAPKLAQSPTSSEFTFTFVGAIDGTGPAWTNGSGFHYLWVQDTYGAGPNALRNRAGLYAFATPSGVTLWFQSVEDYGDETHANRNQVSLTSPLPLAQPVVITVRGSPASTELYINGQRVGPIGPGALATDIAAAFGSSNERVAEMLMYRRALRENELLSLHRYLGNRYDIAMPDVPIENAGAPGVDQAHRITFAIGNLIQSTSAVIDLLSGELLEAGGFYPNGAREEWLGASDQVFGAQIPLEHVGFTGKEADEEVGLTYFGERYLVPRIGRWATPDPLHIHASGGGESGNSYHYVGGSLLQSRDPLGLEGIAVGVSASIRLGPFNVSVSQGVFSIEQAGAYHFGTYTDTPGVDTPDVSVTSAQKNKDGKVSFFDASMTLDLTITPSLDDFKAKSAVVGGGGGLLGHLGIDVATAIDGTGTGSPTVTLHLGTGVGVDIHAGLNQIDTDTALVSERSTNPSPSPPPPVSPPETAGTFRMRAADSSFRVVPGTSKVPPISISNVEREPDAPRYSHDGTSVVKPLAPTYDGKSVVELPAPAYEDWEQGQTIAPSPETNSAEATSRNRCDPRNGE